MISMIEHIEFLLMDHDCVVVPGFGAFIAQYSNSSFCTNNSIFTAPKRNISFNASITHNDGLLANSIAKKCGISYAEALTIVDQNTTVFKQSLAEHSEIPMGRLGFFSPGSEGNFEFVPFHKQATPDDFFGLQSFGFPTLAQLQEAAAEQVPANVVPLFTDDDAQPSSSRYRRLAAKALQYAASIVVLLGLSIALSTPIIVDSPKRQLASMNIPAPKAPKKEAVKPQHIAQPKPQNPVQSTPQAKAANEGQYAIVICTLSSEAQVAEFFKWNKDINPTHVMKKNKHYMIYYQRDNDFIKLKNVAKSMPKRYANYWITKV